MTNGDSIRSISQDFGILPQKLQNWFKRENLSRASKRPQKGTFCHRGGCLKDIEEPLMKWFFELREAGVPMNVKAMVLKARVLDPEFAQKSWCARYHCNDC